MTDEVAAASGAVRAPSLESLLESSDFVTIHLVLSERTRGLIGREQLRRMKKTAFLINTARGAIVDRPALIQALKEGWNRRSRGRVFDAEPLPADDEPARPANLLATAAIWGMSRAPAMLSITATRSKTSRPGCRARRSASWPRRT